MSGATNAHKRPEREPIRSQHRKKERQMKRTKRLPYFEAPANCTDLDDLMIFDRVHIAIDGPFVRAATRFDLPTPTPPGIEVWGSVYVMPIAKGLRMRSMLPALEPVNGFVEIEVEG
jgi:hypothetical protein